MSIVDYFVELGLSFVKDKITDSKEQREIHEILKALIERYKKTYDLCTMAEEIDFEGLSEYVLGILSVDVKKYLFGEKAERDIAGQTIRQKVIAYSHASTASAQERVVDLITNILDILRNYYREKVDSRSLLMVAEITDYVDKQKQQIINEIAKTKNDQNVMSVENMIQLIKQDKHYEVESCINSTLKCISTEHDLHPYYAFVPKIVGGNFQVYSEPLTSDAIRKYPPNISVRGKVKLGNKDCEQLNPEIIDYANRHQIPITINVLEAKKLLGDIPDPIQHEAEELMGKDVVIPPEPFPPAFPCSIILDGNVEFDYVLLRTQEILDDGSIEVSNKEQLNCPYKIKLSINFTEGKTDFSIRTESQSSSDLLRSANFLKKVSSGSKIAIKVLSVGKNLIEGTLNHIEFQAIDKEISILEKIKLIEDYFAKQINIPKKINDSDYEAIEYLSSIIKDGAYSVWSKSELSADLDDKLKKYISELDDSVYRFSYVGNITISLFNVRFNLLIKRVFDSMKIENIEKLKQKAEVLDCGDTIKITFVPGDGSEVSSYYDIIYTEHKNDLCS